MQLTDDKKINQANQINIVPITHISTPLGPMLAGAVLEGICLLEFTDRRMLPAQLKRLSNYLKAKFTPGAHQHFASLTAQLNEYFCGERKVFDLPLVAPGSDFQKNVWEALQQIPYGETISYQEQAAALNKSKAVRAIAKANGDNRIAIIIPCHRVIGANGKMVGYSGGIWRKKYLLDLEKKHK